MKRTAGWFEDRDMPALARSLALLSALTLSAIVVTACHKKETASADVAVTPPVVTAQSTDLLFTWIDDAGNFHKEMTPASVPEAARALVRVQDPTKLEPAEKMFLVDLRAPGPDGKYPVHVAARDDFEGIAVARRAKDGGVLAATSGAPAPSASAGESGPLVDRPTVIIYGASWCGPCHQAADYLKKRGVSYVLKDIEEDGDAAREMRVKLSKAGRRGGSIPVIDVKGRILVGFNQQSVDEALGQAL